MHKPGERIQGAIASGDWKEAIRLMDKFDLVSAFPRWRQDMADSLGKHGLSGITEFDELSRLANSVNVKKIDELIEEGLGLVHHRPSRQRATDLFNQAIQRANTINYPGVRKRILEQIEPEGGGNPANWNIAGAQTGGFIVPGSGNGDTVSAVVPGGSFVLNKNASKAMGAYKRGGNVPVRLEPGETVFTGNVPDWAPKLNAAVPRFQNGGFVDALPQQAGNAASTADLANVESRVNELIGVVRTVLGDQMAEMIGRLDEQNTISRQVAAQPVRVEGEIPLVPKGALQVQGQGGSANMDQNTMNLLTSAVAGMLPTDQQGMLQASYLLNQDNRE